MGNRVSSGRTGDFQVQLFSASAQKEEEDNEGQDGEQSNVAPAALGNAVYAESGEYHAKYNITVAGDYVLHVRAPSEKQLERVEKPLQSR